MNKFFVLIRIKQWVKNLFLFVPGFFAGVMFEKENMKLAVAGFFCFSFVASSIYIINDLFDVSMDRNHPKKKFRPLASGEVTTSTALVICGTLMASSLVWSYMMDEVFFKFIALYIVINLAYSAGLKNISILDIMLVASGFLIRALAGGQLVDVQISKWLFIMVYLLALFLALAKRLDDFLVKENVGRVSRTTVKNYNLNFIYSGITMIAGIIAVSYIMYTISDDVMQRMHSEHLYITSVFVVAGILRYLQITLVEHKSGSPTNVLLTDRFIFFTLIGWITSFLIIIYW